MKKSRIRIRRTQLEPLMACQSRLPIGENTSRAIVLKLTTAFPMCAWAFLKMI